MIKENNSLTVLVYSSNRVSSRAQLHCCIQLFINKVIVRPEKLSHIKAMRINPQINDIVQKYITVISIFLILWNPGILYEINSNFNITYSL